MKYNTIIIFLLSLLLLSCNQYGINESSVKIKTIEKKYKNSGFALLYNENLKKKLDQRSLNIFHKNLKKKSFVKLTNPTNGKSLIAEVISNKVSYSPFYNSVITKRIAENLDLSLEEPYIDIVLISKNSTFIAKKTKTYEEEKNVAEKAPIDGIQISNLNIKNKSKINITTNKKFSYSIKVADFYYKDTAESMIDRIKDETKLKNLIIIQLSKTNYRVLIGPFNDIKTLKDSYEIMNSLYFENLEILKNV
ncbi:hypothetical protein IDG86_03370 [Pelagibacterales bacterium SAG-MED13]|nr:hypothetical protein [Pelagibacterales bacterium SAG-MED13]